MSFSESLTSTLGSSSSGSLNEQVGRTLVEQGVHDLGELDIQGLNLKVMEQSVRASGAHHIIDRMENTSGVLLKHDYVLLQVGDNMWIKAEKGGESERGRNDAGIRVYLVENLKDPKDLKNVNGSSIRFETNVIHLGEGKKKWILKPMIRLLTAGNPNYNILAANCWEYAFSSSKAILQWSIDNAQSVEVQGALTTKQEELKGRERPQPNKVIEALVDPNTPESEKTRRTFNQKLSDTMAKLPANSTVRRRGVEALQHVFHE